jgi:DNA-binding response OmpR family regulator
VHATTPDVVVLDVGLPDIPGTSVCEAIRAAHPELPVLMLTARGELGSRMAGFEAGADDYLVKPFALRELAARLKALLRRTRHASMMQGDVQVGDLRCAMSQRRAWLGDSELSLTRREFDLLAKLMSAPGIALSRGTLLDTVWGDELEPASNVVDQYVRRLRSKVGTSRIETIRSVGYRLRKEP